MASNYKNLQLFSLKKNYIYYITAKYFFLINYMKCLKKLLEIIFVQKLKDNKELIRQIVYIRILLFV